MVLIAEWSYFRVVLIAEIYNLIKNKDKIRTQRDFACYMNISLHTNKSQLSIDAELESLH